MMRREYRFRGVLLALAGCFLMLAGTGVQAARGGISTGQTRVIFGGGQKSEKVTLTNQSDRVYLINSRVLRTPDSGAELSETLPFMVTPPLFRLESNSKGTVMVVRNDTSGLPADRESVFYLSFLAIPSVNRPDESDNAGEQLQPRVSVGIRTVIKLFYRPVGLAVPVQDAPEKLMFALQGNILHVENPTPYYQTLAQLRVNGQTVDVREQGTMIAPYSGADYHITGQVSEVSWSVINDYGGVSPLYRAALKGQ